MIHVLSLEWKVETQSLMPALQERRGFCCFDPVVPQQSYPLPAQCIPLLPDASPSGRADLLLWVRLPDSPGSSASCKKPPENLHSCLLYHTVQRNTSKDCHCQVLCHAFASYYVCHLFSWFYCSICEHLYEIKNFREFLDIWLHNKPLFYAGSSS